MTASTAIIIRKPQLIDFVRNVFVQAGVSEEHGSIVADCLVMANLSGIDSHGVIRLAHYIRRLENGTIKTCPKLSFEATGPAAGILDGDDGLGHVATYQACQRAMELARECGTGAVSIKNSSHPGMVGFYSNHLAEAGFISLVTVSTDAFLIPFGARKPFFGTNPIAFGFPAASDPVILDMATTSIPYGKVALAKIEGRSIPPDWGFDKAGTPTTDPNEIAGLHPIAGPKGSGLAMIIDIFSSVLSGMPWGPHINRMYHDMEEPRKLGHFVLALDVNRFMPLEMFKQRLGAMLEEFGSLEPADGFKQVYAPGHLEAQRRAERSKFGIPIEPGLALELRELGEKCNVVFPG